MDVRYVTMLESKIPVVETRLDFNDLIGALKVRLGINRMNYAVEPGLYAVGSPDAESLVFVSSNYKLSFDLLRKELSGMNAFILVLDTRGVNVWCAAGKGTFGTDELIRQIRTTGLKDMVRHRELVLPQLSAPGIAGYKVFSLTGFRVLFGPVRAADIREYLKNGKKADQRMRNVSFDLLDRLVLIPVETRMYSRHLVYLMITGFFLSGLNRKGYSITGLGTTGIRFVRNMLYAYLCGTCDGPILLPWLPGRAFSVKGLVLGVFAFAILAVNRLIGEKPAEMLAWMLLVPVMCSFLLLNFTGASTFTSLSGVRKELDEALPIQKTVAAAGLAAWCWSLFSGGKDG